MRCCSARDALVRALTELNAPAHRRNVQDGAVVVIDNATGEIRAWVGSSGALSGARDVDAVLARAGRRRSSRSCMRRRSTRNG